MSFFVQKHTVGIGEEEDAIPVRETMATTRCFVAQIASCYVSSLHNSLYNLTEGSLQAFTKGQKDEGLDLPCMTVKKWA